MLIIGIESTPSSFDRTRSPDQQALWEKGIIVIITGGCILGIGIVLWLIVWIRHCCDVYAPPLEESVNDLEIAASAPPSEIIDV